MKLLKDISHDFLKIENRSRKSTIPIITLCIKVRSAEFVKYAILYFYGFISLGNFNVETLSLYGSTNSSTLNVEEVEINISTLLINSDSRQLKKEFGNAYPYRGH